MKFALSLSHNCNLACKYCYSGNSRKDDMSIDTARKIVNFAKEKTLPAQKIEFGFFGGEPLLRFDLICDIIGYIRRKFADIDTKGNLRISITTNGTLLDQAMLDFFRSEQIDLCISIDGGEAVHNLNRCYKNGKGSFGQVTTNLKKAIAQLDYLQVNAVYAPDTIDALPQTVSYLAGLDIPVIHLNPDICCQWNEEACQKLPAIYMRLAEDYIESFRKGNEIALNLIDSKLVIFLKKGYAAEDKCSMGEAEWGFAPSGNIYPCERLIGEDNQKNLCMGNIHTGFDPARRCTILKQKGNANQECFHCELKDYCMNWCGCTNYYMTGKANLVGAMLCKSERAAINAARYVFTTLTDETNELFIDHLMQYLHVGSNYKE